MKRHNLNLIFSTALIVALVVLAGCSQPAAASTPPEEVVDAFYRWYLGYPGNVLADRAYRDSEVLSQEFKAEVDELLDSFAMGAYDPFLMAQDIPAAITVQDVTVNDTQAIVTVEQDWFGNFTRELDIEMVLIEDQWLITGVIPPESVAIQPDAQMDPADSPEGVVQGFYAWYLDYAESRNPLADGAYRSHMLLTERFITEVDELLASFDKGGYDPFLCAQDIPASFAVTEVTVTGQKASIVVETSFAGHRLGVELKQLDGHWRIDDITCLNGIYGRPAVPGPTTVVRTFYGEYLAAMGDRLNPSNPVTDGAYRTSPHLAPQLVSEIDELVASFDKGGYDPFLCAQDIPDSITVGEPSISGSSASVLVSTSFEGHGFEVILSMAQDGWLISAIHCGSAPGMDEAPAAAEPPASEGETAIPADWQVLRDEEYGFEIWYPADWATVEIPLRDAEPGSPDAIIVRLVQILPAEWAAKMNIGGPPDPNNSVVAPISLEVSVGDMQEYRRIYYEMAQRREIEINGIPVILEQDEPSDYQVSRYMFRHPADSDLYITLVDYISGFSQRAEGNEAIVEPMNRIVATFSFTE